MELEKGNEKYKFTLCEGFVCWGCNVYRILPPLENGFSRKMTANPNLVMFSPDVIYGIYSNFTLLKKKKIQVDFTFSVSQLYAQSPWL